MLFDSHVTPTPPEKSSNFSQTNAKLDALLSVRSFNTPKVVAEFSKLLKNTKKARTFKGFKWVGKCTVKFSEILDKVTDNDGDGNAHCRANGISEPNVDSLEESFKNGVDYASRVPILKLQHNEVVGEGGVKTGEKTDYVLMGGHHRVKAFKKLGFTEWVFDVYQYDPLNSDGINGQTLSEYEATKTAQIRDNDHAPAGRTTIADVIKTTLAIMKDKSSTSIARTPNGEFVEDSIKDYIESIAPTMNGRDRRTAHGTILNEQMNAAKTSTNGQVSSVATDFYPYTAASAEKYLTRTPGGWKSGGKLDEVRDMHGYTMGDNNLSPLYNAMFKVLASVKDDKGNIDWEKTPKECYLIVHADNSPTETKPHDATIAKMFAAIEKFQEAVTYLSDYTHKTGKFPITIVGRLPQIPDVDNFDEMIPVTSKKFKTKQ
jgi:hypothetical protein